MATKKTFDDFFNKNHGTKPDDYFFVYNSKGAKLFYSKLTGKIKKSDIDPSFIDKIKETKTNPETGEYQHFKILMHQKTVYLERIQKALNKIDEINKQMSKVKIPPGYETKYSEQTETEKEFRTHYQDDKDEFDDFIQREYKQYEYYWKKPDPDVSTDILKEYGITDKITWKKWLIQHHPDKIGKEDKNNEELCKNIISAGKKMGY
jgi:hypothetical protein